MQEANSYYPALSELSYTLRMDAVRKLLMEKADEAGVSLKSLSERVGRNHAYLQQFIRRGIPTKLPEDVRHKLSEILKVPETALGAPAKMGVSQEAHGEAPQNDNVPAVARKVEKIPLHGQILAGQMDAIQYDDEIAQMVYPPSELEGVPGAYMAYVVGDSMEDRFQAGEIVLVNPRQPPRRGDDVAVQLHPDEGGPIQLYVKRLISPWPAKTLRLLQFNPRREIEYPRARVRAVHRIVGTRRP